VLDAELLTDPGGLDALVPEWTQLAVASALPMSLPEWMLSWLRHHAPEGSELRAIAVRERERLVGLGPFFVAPDSGGRIDYRVLNAPMPRISPLAVPGREWEVAEAIASVLNEASPRPDAIALEALPVASHWAAALRERWPGKLRPIAREYLVQASPTVSLEAGSFDGWLATKSSNFRSEIRRKRRDFAAAGGTTRSTTAATLEADIATYVRLHAMRWEGRGDSSIVALGDRMPKLLAEVGRAGVESRRFRLTMLEVAGQPIAAHLCAAAGGEVIFLNSGFDERYSRLSPGVLGVLVAIEEGFALGDSRVDLAPGVQLYKTRMADGTDPVAWTLLIVPGRRLPLSCARTAPMLIKERVRATAKRALSDEQANRVRALRARLGSG
jgi:CelD/BcsL family acetyltransferase involved in cellulose biosynthesis